MNFLLFQQVNLDQTDPKKIKRKQTKQTKNLRGRLATGFRGDNFFPG